jgi:hypothetical protein
MSRAVNKMAVWMAAFGGLATKPGVNGITAAQRLKEWLNARNVGRERRN